jgi:[ribosomal protein S5]-alanine N-acetyltransferase
MKGPLPPTPRLKTQRLVLRRLRLGDAPAIQRGFDDWEVVRHLNPLVPWPYPADGARTHIRACLAAAARGEKFFWVLTMREGPDEAIGRIDLWPEAEGEKDMRGFWLARAYWGRGLMSEAAEAVTAFAFETLGWPHLWLTNAAANGASHRIKEKQGAELIETSPALYVGGPGLRETWLLRREAWLAARGRAHRHTPRDIS